MNDFCEKHKISIVDTNKRYATYTALRPQYFNSSTDYNSVNTEIVNSFEPLYTITIPLSELERIKEFEEQVFNNMKQYGAHHYQMFEIMMEQKHKEKRLRDKYSAVKKAYEHYSLMLKLAESGEL
tara:strand:- start:68 stop:442 length:375 start_codon:yes stop_codon:yes gene_type:complete